MRIDGNADIKQLISFMEIVKEESFTRAARNLRIGQATISHHINNLEELTGKSLFYRSSRKVELTVEGRLLQAFCKKLFRDIEGFQEKLKEGDSSNYAKIAASNVPGTYLIPRAIGKIRRSGIDYRYFVEIYDSREVIEKLKDGTADIGFTGSSISHPLLDFRPVCQDRIILIGPPESPDSITCEELSQFDFILRHKGSGTRTAWEGYLNNRGISSTKLKVVCESSSTECVKQSVIEGNGLAFISNRAVERKLKSGLIKEIKVEGMDLKRNFYMVTRKDRALTGPEKVLMEMLESFG